MRANGLGDIGVSACVKGCLRMQRSKVFCAARSVREHALAVREFFAGQFAFYASGIAGGNMPTQLKGFNATLRRYGGCGAEGKAALRPSRAQRAPMASPPTSIHLIHSPGSAFSFYTNAAPYDATGQHEKSPEGMDEQIDALVARITS